MNLEFATAAISRVIAPQDDMFFGNGDHYFAVGSEATSIVQRAVAHSGMTQVNTLLDLPCGYGRVLRWLRAGFPQARITACDSNAEAVTFCAQNFGDIRGVVARHDNTHLGELGGPFDVIWCGSLLTHWDEPHWVEHLRFCASRLARGGVLVFTTHGEESVHWLESGRTDYGLPRESVSQLLSTIKASGFAYVNYPGFDGYGISIAMPTGVHETLARLPELKLTSHHPAAWDKHQDVWITSRR